MGGHELWPQQRRGPGDLRVDVMPNAIVAPQAPSLGSCSRLSRVPGPARPRVILLGPGRHVAVRPALPQDAAGIAALFAGLSAESFTWRFRVPHSPSRTLLRLARIDNNPGTVSVIAERLAGVRFVVAEARIQPLGDGLAELGIAVADSYQSGGLGRLLLDAVLEQAQHRGLRRLRAVVSLANTPMLGLLAPRGWVISEPANGGVIYLEGAPDQHMPAFPPQILGARRVLVEGGDWEHDVWEAAPWSTPAAPRATPWATPWATPRATPLATPWATPRGAGVQHDVVRRCLGPGQGLGGTCPLVVAGRCRLAEGADVIVSRLSGSPEDAAVLREHRQRWPERLA